MCMLNGKTSFPIPNVLTAYYEDIIKGIVCASGCTKSKVVNDVKRKFEDQDNIPAAADNAADNAAADAAPTPPPTPPPPRRTGAHPWGLLRTPALLARAARGRSQQGLVRRVATAKADAN